MNQASKRPVIDVGVSASDASHHEAGNSPKRRREASTDEIVEVYKERDPLLEIPSGDIDLSEASQDEKLSEAVDMSAITAYIERLRSCDKFRKLYYGTTNFLICLGLTCNLTMNTIFTALTMVHRSTVELTIEKIDRRCYSAAALCLAWKYWEDREGLKRNHKIKDLACGIYLLSRLPAEDDEGISLLQWMRRDGGLELNRLRDRIKLYEVLILRALHLQILNDECLYLTGYFSAATRSLCPQVESNIEVFDTLQTIALGVVMDFCRWPLMQKFPLKSIVYAAVLKSTVILKIQLIEDDATMRQQQQLYMAVPYLSEILECIRLTYDWVEELT